MPQAISIRPARVTDYPAVDRLGRLVQADHAAAHPEVFRPGVTALTENRFRGLLANAKARLLVAEEDQRVVGLVVLERREAPDYPVFVPRTVVVVEILVVEPGAQGMGVGRHLIEAARDWSREIGAAAVELGVFEFNRKAIGFYEHLGFTTLRRTMAMPVGPPVDQADPGKD
jgi:GNAT superfamily N-acetyltransferase